MSYIVGIWFGAEYLCFTKKVATYIKYKMVIEYNYKLNNITQGQNQHHNHLFHWTQISDIFLLSWYKSHPYIL